MPKIKLDGEVREIEVLTDQFKRVRHITRSEKDESHGSAETRIDYTQPLYVTNKPGAVMKLVLADAGEAGLFGKLTMQDGEPVWFRGPSNAIGPVPITKGVKAAGINSALKLAGKIQFVRETPDQVATVIEAAKGTVVLDLGPQIESGIEAQTFESTLSDDSVWDFDVPELKIVVPSNDV